MNQPPVTAAEIADLAAWARTLTAAGTAAEPADRAAYLAAKADLLARIADQHAHDWQRDHANQARQIAIDARTVADHATTSHKTLEPSQYRAAGNAAPVSRWGQITGEPQPHQRSDGAKSQEHPGASWG